MAHQSDAPDLALELAQTSATTVQIRRRIPPDASSRANSWKGRRMRGTETEGAAVFFWLRAILLFAARAEVQYTGLTPSRASKSSRVFKCRPPTGMLDTRERK